MLFDLHNTLSCFSHRVIPQLASIILSILSRDANLFVQKISFDLWIIVKYTPQISIRAVIIISLQTHTWPWLVKIPLLLPSSLVGRAKRAFQPMRA